ncbi:beta expansin 6 [Abeliophyllum distichum]|uniref:Beta expansin 6 n=1 Tax=Abeliophyllum distichum TaxID=126358 RepID=A0ABD1RU70_9LAMI
MNQRVLSNFQLSNVLSIFGICRVPCLYRSTPIVFKIDNGSNKDYLAFAIEFENGDGDLAAVDLIVLKNNKVLPMKRSFGATFETGFTPDTSVGPYSVRLTSVESRKTIVAPNVLPAAWKPGQVYRSTVNF